MLQHIYIVSDGSGRTARQLIKSALVQYETTQVETHIRALVRKEEQIMEIIEEAHELKALIIHTLVSSKLRHLILEQGRLHDLHTIDVMGPLLGQLTQHFENYPSEKPGIFHVLNKAYFQRIDAIEFALRHDDGQHVDELESADIVLLGVSRTFKTPLSVYMAHKGWRTANVPIILDFLLPEKIYKLPPEKIFCLTTNSTQLTELRKIRTNHLKGYTGKYSNYSYVKKEINYANRIFRMHPEWKIVNVTKKPIEEISSE
ncbi:MAG: pyruvate, water dikinase regulatory protein, partial [Bacteroidota bacterium]